MSSPLLFEQLNFLILVASEAELPIAHSTKEVLMENSCNNCQIYELYNEDVSSSQMGRDWFIEKFGPQTVHFVISNTINFSFYNAVYFDLLIPVISHAWVQDSVKTKRHLRTNIYSPNPFHLLRDCQVYISKSSFNKCEYILYSDLLHLLGGTSVNYISNRTTHVIVQGPKDPIIETVNKLTFGSFSSSSSNKHAEKPLREWKFVYPTWLLYHFKMAKPLTDELATLCELDMNDTTEEQLFAKWEEVIGGKEISSSRLTLHPNTTLFKDHHFAISPDLNFFTPLYWFLKEFIEDLDGKVTPLGFSDDLKLVYEKSPDIDCYIGHSANSPILGKTENIKPKIYVGNVSWLFYMFAIQQFAPVSQCKLIHQPFHAKLFTFKELTVAYTNYFGSQRFYIQRLVEILGGLSTPELTRKNTHLITKNTIGKKFKVAKKWSLDPQNAIIVTNHMWLEQCYMKNAKLNPRDSKFQNFKLDDNMKWNIGRAKMGHLSLQTPDISPMTANDMQPIPNELSPINDQTEGCANMHTTKDNTPNSTFTNSIDEKIDKLQKISEEVDKTHQENLRKDSDSSTSTIGLPPIDNAKVNSLKKNSISDIGVKAEVLEDYQIRKATETPKTSVEYDVITTQKPARKISGQEMKDQPRKKNDTDCLGKEKKTRSQIQLDQQIEEEYKVSEENEAENMTKGSHIEPDELTKGKYAEENTAKPNPRAKHLENTNPKSEADKYSRLFEGLSDSDDRVDDAKAIGNSRYATPKTSQNIKTTVGTPVVTQTGTRTPSNSNSRLAKTQAAKRLHTDIESLNEFQKSLKRKRIDTEEIMLPQKTEKSNKEKQLTMKVDNILSNFSELPDYNLKAVCTGCFHDGFNEIDIEILSQLGINIFDNVKETDGLNCIIAPKILRTEKFLKSLSFEPLKFALKPEFIIDLLNLIHNKKEKASRIDLNLFNYVIHGIDQSILSKTRLPTKVFERANIRCINLVNDISGGVNTIGSVLKAHGIEKINVLRSKKCVFEDVMRNDVSKQESGGIFKYILIVTRASQVKKFTKLISDHDKNCTILIVEWNWCVESIFHLDVDLTSKSSVLYKK
ncbi:Rtt107p SKDI_08G2010 [Saccharomyces kudriavzevii IFO 1802]|uniref:BRCT domain-containing protein n=1 Tax=Saccharomyces kudriavzevii (strain ATCC MYA-4449 / AS 2.2408 / CBS 8840 / NBRC 1802 / NCYC 2889) TaxID=226230 RepID=A0AA35JJ39_SACK1|nr:uncharacterized protein SKDI_08G2010 [Saccharomyces kudriavzevii IFO 1802]CAI4064017.1 hypothetical protein SKDI_08G2010 [Saccharomyces kudriavzevii IFO 1802]